MPLNDAYGQGVPYHVLDDAADAQTLGEGIVNGVVPRTAMRFNSAAHRGAVIADPQAGMMSWLRDVRRFELYDGSRWVTFGTGHSAWNLVPITSAWEHGAVEATTGLQYRVTNLFGDPAVMFRGAVTRPNYPPGNFEPTWLTLTGEGVGLPAPARPEVIRRAAIACSGLGSSTTTVRLDLRTTGEMRIYGLVAGVRPPWISFDGVYVSL